MKHPHFSVHIKPRSTPRKVLFYFSSYRTPWWVYLVPILRFRRLGYEVVVYDLENDIMENNDTSILPTTVRAILDDMSARREAYIKQGVETFHCIGNSLGSYMAFNGSQRIPFDGVVLNSVGSAAEVLFTTKHRHLKKTTARYVQQRHDRESLQKIWEEFDRPSNGHRILAPRVLITYSLKDELIPPTGPVELMQSLEASGIKYEAHVDHLPHIASILLNAYRVRSIYRFLNSPPET